MNDKQKLFFDDVEAACDDRKTHRVTRALIDELFPKYKETGTFVKMAAERKLLWGANVVDGYMLFAKE